MVAGKTSLLLVATCLLLCCFATRAEAAHGRQLTQYDCDDCACAEVSCAELCGSANKIDSFTCDEAGLFTEGSYFCSCMSAGYSGGSPSSAGESVKPIAALGLLSVAAVALAF